MDLLKSVAHPSELLALVKFKYGGGKETIMPHLDISSMRPSLKRCYGLLNATSRSFAAVIQALDSGLRDAICIFYLVLRALDTVEDDMSIPSSAKVPLLQSFHTNLFDAEWKYNDSQEKDRAVLEEFPIISQEFRNLDTLYQDIIADITKRMGSGMCVFLEEKIGSISEWDEYCHYVAGLVGIGLSRIFSASKLEDVVVGKDTALANSMGLFLQKTNIIRDYLEDVSVGREFWPKEGWNQFGETLKDFTLPANLTSGLACLNFLITNALQHIPDQIKYMSRLQNQSVFNFCAIPQVMAMATLSACYNNPRVLSGVVKIRRGEAVDLMMTATNMNNFKAVIYKYAQDLLSRVPPSDPSAKETRRIICEVLLLCSDSPCCNVGSLAKSSTRHFASIGTVFLVGVATYYAISQLN